MSELGFGFLRLPLTDPDNETSVDFRAVCALADRFLALGGNYFDTAYTYLGEISETVLREAVVKRYPRDQIRIADKLPTWLIKDPENWKTIFNCQLERCGVDFFDVYLLHGLDRENYEICLRCGLFDVLEGLRERGLARRIGFSYHDSPELLDRILSEQSCVDCVQLQINYLDWESPAICARRCWEVARKRGKAVLVMEPVKGGSLANPPAKAQARLEALRPERSMASWAMGFVRDLPGVEIVLSGMNALTQIEDNMQPLAPLSLEERSALMEAAEIIRSDTAVACTGCGYCTAGCPRQIPIPRCFALYNEYMRSPKEKWKMEPAYAQLTAKLGRASDCIGCGQCQQSCPQKLPVMEHLRAVAAAFEPRK